jgi:hypothetical protein
MHQLHFWSFRPSFHKQIIRWFFNYTISPFHNQILFCQLGIIVAYFILMKGCQN